MSASALANPISKVGSVSKTVATKTYDGAKTVVTESATVVKDAGASAWNASVGLVSHIRSAF